MSQRRIKTPRIKPTQTALNPNQELQMNFEKMYVYYRTLSDMHAKHAELLKEKEAIFSNPSNQNQIKAYDKAAEFISMAIDAYRLQFEYAFPELAGEIFKTENEVKDVQG